MSTDASQLLLADFLAQAPIVPVPTASMLADKLRHDLAVASSDADQFARDLRNKLESVLPSELIAQGRPAIQDLYRRVEIFSESLERALTASRALQAQGVSL